MKINIITTLVLTSVLTLQLAKADNKVIFASDDGNASAWRLAQSEGAEGDLIEADKDDTERLALKITKTNSIGTLLLVPKKDISVATETTYRFSAKIQSLKNSGNGKVFLMVSFPDAERTPFPVSPSIVPSDMWDEVSLEFTTKADEYRLRIHVCVEGEEDALLVSDVKVIELN